MLKNANYFWRAYLERPILETILRTRGPSGVHQGSIGRPFQMSSKFGELIGTALQIWRAHFASSPNWDLKINFLKSVRNLSGVRQKTIKSLAGICQESVRSLSGVQHSLLRLCQESVRSSSGVPQESIGNPSGSCQRVNIFSQVSVIHSIRGSVWGSIRGSLWVSIRGLLGMP